MSDEDEKSLRDRVLESELFLHSIRDLSKEQKDEALDFAIRFAEESQKSLDNIIRAMKSPEGQQRLVENFSKFILNPRVISDAD